MRKVLKEINLKQTINLFVYQTGLSYESNSTAKCNSVPADRKEFVINSIKTDTCLIVYTYHNCAGFGSRKFDLDNTLVFFAFVISPSTDKYLLEKINT